MLLSQPTVSFAGCAHLKELSQKPSWIAAFVLWGIAPFEHLLQVPANRVRDRILSIPALKLRKKIIALGVFVSFAFFQLKQGLWLDLRWAGCCMVGAVYFMFRSPT